MEGKSVVEQDAQATRRTTALRRSTLESLGGNSHGLFWIHIFKSYHTQTYPGYEL